MLTFHIMVFAWQRVEEQLKRNFRIIDRNRTQELHTIQLLLHQLPSNHHDIISRTDAPNIVLFLGFIHVMRRPCWCTEQWQNVAQVLHNNTIKSLEEFFLYSSVNQHGRRDVT